MKLRRLRRSRLILAYMLGLVLFAQLPQALNVCISLGGGVQIGYGCQCRDCLSAPQAAPTALAVAADTGCKCDDPLCLAEPTNTPETAELHSVACCDDFKLPYHAAPVRLRAPQAECSTPVLAQLPAWQLLPRLELRAPRLSPGQIGQPPGRDPCCLLSHTVLLI